jgi:hypothetical protein
MEVVNEVYASTKPYPAWWSNVEESRILRRRKSMGDSVLERNICFVDTNDSAKLENIIHYAEQQLINVMASVNQLANELSALLSGRGSSQVDVILYLISKGMSRDTPLKHEIDFLQTIYRMTATASGSYRSFAISFRLLQSQICSPWRSKIKSSNPRISASSHSPGYRQVYCPTPDPNTKQLQRLLIP